MWNVYENVKRAQRKSSYSSSAYALGTRTKFQLEILIINVFSVIVYFRDIILEISRNVSGTPPRNTSDTLAGDWALFGPRNGRRHARYQVPLAVPPVKNTIIRTSITDLLHNGPCTSERNKKISHCWDKTISRPSFIHNRISPCIGLVIVISLSCRGPMV